MNFFRRLLEVISGPNRYLSHFVTDCLKINKMAFLVAPVIERVRRRPYHRRPRVFRDRTNPLETLSDDEVL